MKKTFLAVCICLCFASVSKAQQISGYNEIRAITDALTHTVSKDGGSVNITFQFSTWYITDESSAVEFFERKFAEEGIDYVQVSCRYYDAWTLPYLPPFTAESGMEFTFNRNDGWSRVLYIMSNTNNASINQEGYSDPR